VDGQLLFGEQAAQYVTNSHHRRLEACCLEYNIFDRGEIYTWATDRRYPECLGRDPEEQPPEIPAKIPYFSETKIVKVAAGGYMTAALSEDGELFLWGRSPPGAGGELTIFKSDPMQSEERRVRYMTPLGGLKFTLALQPKQSQQSKSTAAEETEYAKRKRGDPATSTTRTALSLPEPRFTGEAFPDNMDTEQEQPMDTDTPDALPPHSPCASDAAYADPYIKLVELSLGGVHSAKVTDVAIGNGHILVAVEAQNEQGKTLRGVFAAGQGTHGQLGRGDGHVFGEEFSEIHTFSGKKVRQLVAAGWTSWVVVEGK
jgi:alpha-tubulin suppressor-like RCC1 family protein